MIELILLVLGLLAGVFATNYRKPRPPAKVLNLKKDSPKITKHIKQVDKDIAELEKERRKRLNGLNRV